MDTPHKESLYRVTLYVLRRCREMAPVRINIAAADMEPVDGTDPESVFADGVEFLRRLGIIDYGAMDAAGTMVIEAQLTDAGRQLLNSQPRSLTTHSSLGDRIVAVSKSGSKRAMAETMSLIVRAIANGGGIAAAITVVKAHVYALATR